MEYIEGSKVRITHYEQEVKEDSMFAFRMQHRIVWDRCGFSATALFHIGFCFVFGFSWRSLRTWSPSTRWPSRTWTQRSQRQRWTRPNIRTGPTSPLLICNGINGCWPHNKDDVFKLQPLNDLMLDNINQINHLLSFIRTECGRHVGAISSR